MPARKAKSEFNMDDFPNLASDEARKAFVSALDSLSKWRDEIVATTERNSDKAFDAMAEAARSLGWPDDIVKSLKLQLEGTTELQVQYMDSVMDAWVSQVKNPGQPMADPSAWLAQMPTFDKTFPGFNMPNYGAMGFNPVSMTGNPLQLWMQGAEFWQKAWMQAFTAMTDMQKSAASKK